jgi:hypothetical protein
VVNMHFYIGLSIRYALQTQWSGVHLGHFFLWGYRYGDLAPQVGGASDETVKYGYGSCATLTSG